MNITWPEWIVFGIAFFFLAFHIKLWRSTWFVFGERTIRYAWITLLLSCRSFKLFYVFGSLVLFFLAPTFLILGISPSIAMLTFSNAVVFLSIVSRPAIAIFLASSNPESVALRDKIMIYANPHRSISFLDSAKSENFDHKITIAFDNTSFLDDEQWLPLVQEFIRIAPIVIIDLREPSESIYRELGLIIKMGAASKTFFLVGSYDMGMISTLIKRGEDRGGIYNNDSELINSFRKQIEDKAL